MREQNIWRNRCRAKEYCLRVYRELRQVARETLAQVQSAGYTAVKADSKGEAMEIFRLTCLEEGVHVEKKPSSPLPEVRADGTRFEVVWPEGGTTPGLC